MLLHHPKLGAREPQDSLRRRAYFSRAPSRPGSGVDNGGGVEGRHAFGPFRSVVVAVVEEDVGVLLLAPPEGRHRLKSRGGIQLTIIDATQMKKGEWRGC